MSILLEWSSGGAAVTALDEINAVLRGAGAGVWPLDLADTPGEIRSLIDKPRLSDDEAATLKAHFLLSRERLIEVVGAAGRAPNVEGGGALETVVTTHGYGYPQLYVVEADADYSRFDVLHSNQAEDGTGVDEVIQLLCGEGFAVHQRMPGGDVAILRLACPAPDTGWLITYDGKRPHIGSVSSATPGSKLVVQAFGPPAWVVAYEDG